MTNSSNIWRSVEKSENRPEIKQRRPKIIGTNHEYWDRQGGG